MLLCLGCIVVAKDPHRMATYGFVLFERMMNVARIYLDANEPRRTEK